MKYATAVALLLLALVCDANVWGAPQEKFRENLNRFVTEALENNPELKEAQETIRLFKEIPPQAGSLDDPRFKFEFMNLPINSFSFTDQPMTQKQITLSQKLPFPGKLGLKTQMALKDVKLAEQSLEEVQLRIIRDVKLSFYELCFVIAAIDITRQNKELLKQLVSIAETKYSVGKGIQQDVLKAQVELSKIMDDLIKLDERRKGEQAKLNTLMNRLPQAPLKIAHGIRKTEFNYTLEDLQKRALQTRPLLKELKILAAKSMVSRQLAKREFFPDFDVGLRFGRREEILGVSNPDFVSAFVSINIPVWQKTKQSRKVAEERYRTRKIQEAYNKTRSDLFLKIKLRTDEEEKSSDLIKLIKTGIIPQALQSLDSAMAGYSVDKVDFLTMLDSQVTLFKWEIQHHKELAEHEKTMARLEYLVGEDLFWKPQRAGSKN